MLEVWQIKLQAIVVRGFEALGEALTEVEQRYKDDPQKQLEQGGLAYVRLAVESPEITQIMFGGYIDRCPEEFKDDAHNAYARLEHKKTVYKLHCYSMAWPAQLTMKKILLNLYKSQFLYQKR